jgi:hypothetical protein
MPKELTPPAGPASRTPSPSAPGPLSTPQAARARVAIGGFSADAEVAVTPAGLLAYGAFVAMILLAVVPIVRAKRARPHAGWDASNP